MFPTVGPIYVRSVDAGETQTTTARAAAEASVEMLLDLEKFVARTSKNPKLLSPVLLGFDGRVLQQSAVKLSTEITTSLRFYQDRLAAGQPGEPGTAEPKPAERKLTGSSPAEPNSASPIDVP